jgi:hypothetical protein
MRGSDSKVMRGGVEIYRRGRTILYRITQNKTAKTIDESYFTRGSNIFFIKNYICRLLRYIFVYKRIPGKI